MAVRAHLIIDGRPSGLPNAPGYYRVFPQEPSPLGDLSFRAADTTVMNPDASLDNALDLLARAGPGGVAVLVCHAFSGGLLLVMAPGGTRALSVVDNLKIIDQAIAAEAEVERIRKLPRKEDAEKKAVLDRWEKLINRLQPGSITGTFKEAEAEKFYAKWFEMISRKMEFNGSQAFRRFLAKLLRLRGLKLSRLELRACNIGNDKETMEFVRKFFNVEHLTAPTVGTFYHSPITIDTMMVASRIGVGEGRHIPRGFRMPAPLGHGPVLTTEQFSPRAGATAEDVRESNTILKRGGHTSRGFLQNSMVWFTAWRVLGTTHVTKFFHFILTVDETSAFHYRASAAVSSTGNGVTQDWTKVGEFVRGWIMDSSTYATGQFPIAGLWTPDIQDQPFVLPNETSYIRLIEQVPSSS